MSNDAIAVEGDLADRDSWRATNCPVGSALDVMGTRSAILIMREAYYGTTRFDDFAARVGVTDAIAAARLRELTAAGLLERHPYQEPGKRTRYEYRLTTMGLDLAPVVVGLFGWGAKYLTDAPIDLTHRDCGAAVQVEMRCTEGHALHLGDVSAARRTKSPR